MQASIAEERGRLAGTRGLADHVIDTSGLSIGQLKDRIFAVIPRLSATDDLRIDIVTFGFKYGIPLEADLVFDVRFLTNPYWDPKLKPLSGLDEPVRDFVLRQPAAKRFLDLVAELLELTAPAYRAEGKEQLRVALGCTGGYHRSIALAEALAARLREAAEGVGRGLPPGARAMKGPRLPRWLYPGMHLKRWLVLLLAGIAILGLGAAIFIRDLYRQNAADEIAVVYWLTGAWLEPEIRAALVAVLGLTLTGIGFWGLMRSVISPFVARGGSVMEVLYTKRYLARGPRIVALGGGTGLSTLLRGLKGYSANITAVVAVADDGGSSGRLRQQLGIVPPGDIRNCIAALADAEPLMTQLMQYRFPSGSGLDDHAFGNLFIAAMTAVTGDFEEAVRESNRVLAVRGQVLPATSVPLNLSAQLASGRYLYGQVGDHDAPRSRSSGSSSSPTTCAPTPRRSSASSRRR